MTAVERLTVEIMRLSTILERVEPRLERLERQVQEAAVRDAWRMGAAATAGALGGALLPVLARALGLG